jgi:RHS repeat-associated protein
MGNKTRLTDANGNTTIFIYNATNQLTAETNALGKITTYTYDGNGNRLTITDANGNTSTNTFDPLNRITKTTYPDGTFETFSFDADGNLIARTDRNGKTINKTYDALHRLTIKTYPDTTTANYNYDFNGNISAASNINVSYTFIYDSLNRVTQITNNTLGKTVSYSYLCCGLKNSMTNPEGGVINYHYDALKKLLRMNNPHGESTTYTYDNLSRIIKKEQANGNYTTYNYDALSRLVSLINNMSTNFVISSYSYTYDNTINRTSMTTLAGAHSYSYDSIYQLLQTTSPASSIETYTYDSVYNRLTSESFSDWIYDKNNRLMSYDNTIYNYDANGNTLSKTVGSDTANYKYDYENRLIRIDYPDGTYSEYMYDPFGNRITRNSNGTVAWFVYDLTKNLPDVIGEYNESGSLITSYTHGQGVDEVISMRRENSSYFYLKNGLGSVTSLTDDSESVVNNYEYGAFGNVIDKTEIVTNPYGYTGRRFDSESGLMYYRARYYSPATGRFLSVDPIKFSGGMNFYVYSQNNPINFVDPSGKKSYPECFQDYKNCNWKASKGLVGCAADALGPPLVAELFIMAGCSAVCLAANVAWAPCFAICFSAATGINSIWVLYQVGGCIDDFNIAKDQCEADFENCQKNCEYY